MDGRTFIGFYFGEIFKQFLMRKKLRVYKKIKKKQKLEREWIENFKSQSLLEKFKNFLDWRKFRSRLIINHSYF